MHSFQGVTFGRSDVGQKRASNQDAFSIDEEHGLFAIADGIGGLQYGEVASQMAVSLFMQHALQFDLTDSADWQKLFNLIQAHILDEAHRLGQEVSMGTTLTCGAIIGDTLFFGHVGDSILYHYRKTSAEVIVKRLTAEHTLKAEWMRAHNLTEAPAFLPNFYHHTLTHCLGQEVPLAPQIGSHHLKKGDRLLFASDGIFYGWNETLLSTAMDQSSDPKALVEELIDESNRQGGYDNITAIAIFLA